VSRMIRLTTCREDRAPRCAKCGTEMKDVVTIAPVAGDPGLVAYECPDCGHLTSVLCRQRALKGRELS
jgi:predicted RNA-binding Zn-ribbon protein involved in translation (DUF1610 family)